MRTKSAGAKAVSASSCAIESNLLKELLFDMENTRIVAAESLKAAAAILDAADVLCALERAPEHYDTHPSHNVKTGGGYAHGRRMFEDTLPIMLRHARNLVQMANDDYVGIQNQVKDALTGGAA